MDGAAAAPPARQMAEASSRDAASSAERNCGFEFTAEYYLPKKKNASLGGKLREMGLYLPPQRS
jgi:hypothetical protein